MRVRVVERGDKVGGERGSEGYRIEREGRKKRVCVKTEKGERDGEKEKCRHREVKHCKLKYT
jgi:hypothetical protein